jgi:hypothetical protein
MSVTENEIFTTAGDGGTRAEVKMVLWFLRVPLQPCGGSSLLVQNRKLQDPACGKLSDPDRDEWLLS